MATNCGILSNHRSLRDFSSAHEFLCTSLRGIGSLPDQRMPTLASLSTNLGRV